jgi:hypothetical protein
MVVLERRVNKSIVDGLANSPSGVQDPKRTKEWAIVEWPLYIYKVQQVEELEVFPLGAGGKVWTGRTN